MGLNSLFKKDVIEYTPEQLDLLIEGEEKKCERVTVQRALTLPSVYACTELISSTIADLEIKLYEELDGEVKEVKGDRRTTLLNDDTYNIMTGNELKKAMVRDYLLYGVTYVYINGVGSGMKSLHYVPCHEVSVLMDTNILFRGAKLRVQNLELGVNDFIICTKNTVDGINGFGIVDECNDVLKQALDNMEYTSRTMSNGGVKRGVLQSTRRLTADAIGELKKAWRKLYEKNNDCIVLNEGITYKELQQTGAEMQMTESKTAIDADICKLFNTPVNMFNNVVTDAVWSAFVRLAIMPILCKIEQALNKHLLLGSEKSKYYFAFDTKQLNRGDIEKRFKAYEIALKNGFMSTSEVRFEEDLNEIDTLNFIKFSLGDVLMNVDTGEIYTPNTNATTNTTLKGGDDDENGIEK